MNAQAQLNEAIFYALREGCFFPVPEPRPGASPRELIQWGAMRNLHTAIREFDQARAAASYSGGTSSTNASK